MREVTARLKNNDHPGGSMVAGGVRWGLLWQTETLADANAEIVENHHLLDVRAGEAVETDLHKMKKPELEDIAEAEGVDLSGAKNNPQRVEMIEHARKIAADEAEEAARLASESGSETDADGDESDQ